MDGAESFSSTLRSLATLCGRWNCVYFIDKEAEAGGCEVLTWCPIAHEQQR